MTKNSLKIRILLKTAKSAQIQQKHKIHLSVFSTWIYNFGSWLPFDVVIAFEVQGGMGGIGNSIASI